MILLIKNKILENIDNNQQKMIYNDYISFKFEPNLLLFNNVKTTNINQYKKNSNLNKKKFIKLENN